MQRLCAAKYSKNCFRSVVVPPLFFCRKPPYQETLLGGGFATAHQIGKDMALSEGLNSFRLPSTNSALRDCALRLLPGVRHVGTLPMGSWIGYLQVYADADLLITLRQYKVGCTLCFILCLAYFHHESAFLRRNDKPPQPIPDLHPSNLPLRIYTVCQNGHADDLLAPSGF